MTETETTNVFERHAQTVLVMIIVALLLWVGTTTAKTAVSVAEMKVEMKYLRDSPHPVNSGELASIESRLHAIEIQLATLTTKKNE